MSLGIEPWSRFRLSCVIIVIVGLESPLFTILFSDERKVLGSGQFGVVYQGFIKREDGKEIVAVKTVRSNVDVENFKALLAEIKIMAYLEKHEHICCLAGACTSSIKESQFTISHFIHI